MFMRAYQKISHGAAGALGNMDDLALYSSRLGLVLSSPNMQTSKIADLPVATMFRMCPEL